MSVEETTHASRESSSASARDLPSLHDDTMLLDLKAAIEGLQGEEQWSASGHNAVTLAKYPDLRLVLEIMRPGFRMEDGRMESGGSVVVQMLTGRVRVEAGGSAVELSSGKLLALDHHLPTRVEALEESAFLLWLAWSDGRRENSPERCRT